MAILDKQALNGGAEADKATVDRAVGGRDVVDSKAVEMEFTVSEEVEVEVGAG